MLDPARYPHALTLNTDRELSAQRMGSIFSTFCLNVDRTIHGRKNVHAIQSCDRLQAIAFPEHLNSNAHLHVAADLTPYLVRFPGVHSATNWLAHLWRRSSRNAGSIYFAAVCDHGWGEYITKAIRSSDPTYYLSIDFHRS
jgi:hypothetical protein